MQENNEKKQNSLSEIKDENLSPEQKKARDEFKKKLEDAKKLSNQAKFSEARDALLAIEDLAQETGDMLCSLSLIEAYINAGYLSEAERLCLKVVDLAKECTVYSLAVKQAALHQLAGIASNFGSHEIAAKLMDSLYKMFPNLQASSIFQIVHATYATKESNKERTELWAKEFLTVSHDPRPPIRPLNGRPLKIGYVTADLGMHPVGFFIRGVLLAHDPQRVQVVVYNARKEEEKNIIEKIVEANCTIKNVAELNDEELDHLIREDQIDVLVDLSGLTAGTRIACFAREPAPVMIAYLGYWATTGLSSMDAILLDNWHAPEGAEKEFTEKVVRLPVARFCYQPIDEEPKEKWDPPCLERGYITFGCFNNTSKYTSELFDAWGEILHRVPNSHILLKWKNFQDPVFQERIVRSFEKRGIERSRIEMLGWSSLYDMLKEYNHVDIALDTFPFSGGITTCNALWMGVPLVSLRGKTAVGRQGYAILGQLGLEDLVGINHEHYINIAVGLASNIPLLNLLRCTLRARMRASPLLDVAGFTKHLEDAFYAVYEEKLKKECSA